MRPLVAALLLAMLSACAGPTDPTVDLASIRVGGSTVRLAITASAAQLPPGVSDTIRATLTNEGPAAVTLHFSSGCVVLPYIRNSAGMTVLPDINWMCIAALTEITLQPGQSRTSDFVWDGHRVLATEIPSTGRLPAGTYSVTVESLPFEGLMRTEPITIELQ